MPFSIVTKQVIKAARMVVTQGLGERRPAHGFFIIVGNACEILSGERRHPARRDIRLCKYGEYKSYLDRRSDELNIKDCLGDGKRSFSHLFHEDGAIVVDEHTGQVCCGGFFVHDLTLGIGIGGARTKAASAMATQANGCCVILASQTICGSEEKPVPPDAAFKVFDRENISVDVPIHESESIAKPSLDQWLRPLKFGADLYLYNKDFVEGTRNWILDDLNAWLSDVNGSRCRVLLAGPGFGKSAIAARLHQMTTRVLAIHLCRHNDSSKRDPRRMIASIAHQIAEVLPQFRDALLKVREAEGAGVTDAYSLRPTARELADCLLFQPLSEIAPSHPTHQGRNVIIIDALDEAEHDAKNDLLDLISFDFLKLPPWVVLLVTARPQVDIRRKLASLRPTELDATHNKEKCDDDVHTYLRMILADKFKDENSLVNAINKVASKANGLFLYLHHIRNTINSRTDIDVLPDDLIDALPDSLHGVYEQELGRALGPEGLGNENSQTRRVLEAIIAAQVPVHVKDELPGLSGVPANVVLERVTLLSQLLPIRDDRVYVFHKLFVDWLTRPKGTFDSPKFLVDRRTAHHHLALACFTRLIRLLSEEKGGFESDAKAVNAIQRVLRASGCVVDDALQSAALDDYALRWIITHLFKAGQPEDLSLAILYSLRFLIKRAPRIDTLIADTARLLPTTKSLHHALVLAQKHVRLGGPQWLAEELWQRLLGPARGVGDLEQLARDARIKARSDLMVSARRPYLTPVDSPLQCILEGHKDNVNSVTAFLDPNGHPFLASCALDKTVRIWDPIKGGEALHVLRGHSENVNGMTTFVDAEGQPRLVSYSDDGTVRIWDPINGGAAVHVLEGHSSSVNGVTTFVDAEGDTWVASCSYDNTVRIWDPIKGGEAVLVFEGHSREVNGITAFVDADGHPWVASCSFDKTVRIWDPTKNGEALHVLRGHSENVNGVTAFVDATGHPWVVSCSDDWTVRIWDPIKGGEAVHVLRGHISPVRSVTAFVDANGTTWLASRSSGHRVRIWDPIKGGEAVHVLEGHSDWVRDITVFVDATGNTWLASCSDDKRVRIWDPIKGGEAVQVLKGHRDLALGVTAFADTTGHMWVASCSDDNTVRIWDPIKGSETGHDLEGHSRAVTGMTTFVDARGRTWVLATYAKDKTARIWDPIKGGDPVRVLRGHSGGVRGLTGFVDSMGYTWVVSCSRDTTLRIWDPAKGGEAVHVLKGHSRSVRDVTAFVDAKDQTWLASCSDDGTIRVWDPIKGGEAVHVLRGHSSSVNGVTAFMDANGHPWVASCSVDKTVRIWDPIKGDTAVHVLEGHSSYVRGVTAFVDANGHPWVASCSDDKTVRIWDPIKGGKAVHVLESCSPLIRGVTAFVCAEGNTWVASCAQDRTVLIWDAIKGGEARCVVPLEIRPTAISAISVGLPCGRGRLHHSGNQQAFIVVGLENGKMVYLDLRRAVASSS